MNSFSENKQIKYVVRAFQGQNFFLTLNVFSLIAQIIYLLLRYQYVSNLIPFWYVKPWGTFQMVEKPLLFLIPMVSAVSIILYIFLASYLKRYYLRFSLETLTFVTLFFNLMAFISLFRIISISSKSFSPLLNPFDLGLSFLLTVGFFVVYLVAPYFVKYFIGKRIVTDPSDHFHPGMALARPSARGGGIIFYICFLAVSLLFVEITKEILTIYIISGILAVFGLLDDYQNTHPKSKLSFLEKPALRLGVLFVLALGFSLSGITIDTITNPLGGIINFKVVEWNLLGLIIHPISIIVTTLWVVWLLNLLSWSNGIDGQYSGIVGITLVVIGILALRFTPLEITQVNISKVALIAAGASLGLLPFNWHPSKVMWGFGAMSVGAVIAGLSLLIDTKIYVTILVIIVPFLDALISVVRRLAQKKNPLKGDRGHLHHLLMQRGWSVKQIAIFYWITTAIFGIIGLLVSEQILIQTIFMVAGLIASTLLILNFSKPVSKL